MYYDQALINLGVKMFTCISMILKRVLIFGLKLIKNRHSIQVFGAKIVLSKNQTLKGDMVGTVMARAGNSDHNRDVVPLKR